MDRRPRKLALEPSAELASRVAWAFVGLGLLLRLSRYLLHFPLWGDESMVAVNLLDRDYAGLLHPLDNNQVCPLFFLWLELSVVKLLGFSEWSLRLFPTIFSIASLLVYRSLAARLLKGWPYALSVAVFAVSYFIVRHGAEAKPYSGDSLATLLLLWLAVVWLDNPSRTRPLWVLAVAVPVCLGFSFTAMFVAGGAGLVLLPVVWRQNRLGVSLAYMSCALATAVAGLALYFGFISPLFNANGPGNLGFWADAFPPLNNPLALPLWLIEVHSGRMLAYPLGSQNGASAGTLLLCLVAIVALWRQNQRQTIALLLAPLAFGLLAAALRRYPYGDSARTMQYVAPAICLLAGVGLATLIAWWRSALVQQRALMTCLALLAAMGSGLLVKDLVQPYKTRFDQVHREFARWFWRDNAADAELVCAVRDLGLDYQRLGGSGDPDAVFACNQQIYSPNSARGQSPRWDRVSGVHPLRVVLQSAEGVPRDDAALQAWLDELQAERGLTLVGVDRYPLNAGTGKYYARVIEVFELVPRDSQRASQPSPETRQR